MDPHDEKNPSPESVLADGLREGLAESGLEARVSRYAAGKRRALDIVAHLQFAKEIRAVSDEGERRYAHMAGVDVDKLRFRLRECGSWLLFKEYFTVGKMRLTRARFCKKHLLCPFCAMRRGAKFVKAYKDRFDAVAKMAPGLRPFLVTFTVKNGDDLAERFAHLRASFETLQQRRRDSRKGARVGFSPFDSIEAAVWSYEVTNRGKGWHPHIHAVCLATGEPPEASLRHAWHELTGDSFMVDVRPIDTTDDAVGALLEVFKYALKFSDLSPEDNVRAWRALSGKRLVGSLGLFRGIDVREWLTDDPDADLDDLPYVERFFRFIGKQYVEGGLPDWLQQPDSSAAPREA